MVLGAIGVAMAMHAHLEQRMDMLAILKAIGADSSDLLRIFLLQTLGLGLAGGLLGVVAGVAVMAALPAAFGQLLPVHVILQFPWQSALAGLGTGLLTTLLFCLPPLLDGRPCGQCRAAQAGGAGARRNCRPAREMVGAAIAACDCGGNDRRPGWHCLGAFPIRRRWARGSRCCSPSRQFCCRWPQQRFGFSGYFSIAPACTCHHRCAMGSRICIAPAINRAAVLAALARA